MSGSVLMRGGAVAISAAAFAWVVVQAQGGCGTEVAPAEPESPAVEAPSLEAPRPAAEVAEPPEPAPTAAEPVPQVQVAPPPDPSPPPAAPNRNAKEKVFFPASKAGVLHTPDPPPQRQQANPAPTP